MCAGYPYVRAHASSGAARGVKADVRRIDERALSLGKANELDARPNDAIRSRSSISHLTRHRHLDGGTGLEVHRDPTIHVQSEHTVSLQTEKFDRIGVAKVYPQTEGRHVDDRALPPEVRWLVFDMAPALPMSGLAFRKSSILHVPAFRWGAASIGEGHASPHEMLTVAWTSE